MIFHHRVTTDIYERVRRRLAELGYGDDYTWSQGLKPPATAEDFASEYTWVVINSGMKNTIARVIFDRVWPHLLIHDVVGDTFKHPGKRAAIDRVWRLRADYFSCFRALPCSADFPRSGQMVHDAVARIVLDWCQTLPWIGAITKYHLAKNLGVDVAKPDRWLVRLAEAGRETVEALCGRLALETGDRVATVDVVLWRACAVGVLTVDRGDIGEGAWVDHPVDHLPGAGSSEP